MIWLTLEAQGDYGRREKAADENGRPAPGIEKAFDIWMEFPPTSTDLRDRDEVGAGETRTEGKADAKGRSGRVSTQGSNLVALDYPTIEIAARDMARHSPLRRSALGN